MMKLSSVLTLFALIGGLLGGSGCVKQRMTRSFHAPPERPLVHDVVTEAPAPELAKTPRILEPPPLPQVELVRQPPGRNYVWIPGHWIWEDGWQWMPGQWAEAPERNAAWMPGRWVNRDGQGWVWMEGHWRVASLN